jgi:RNA polymerase subunit RPABC4/transcription elongation factor Spt4
METERKCGKCQRILEPGESLCPKCKSDRDHKVKTWGQVIVTGLTIATTIAIAIMTGGKGRGPRA